MGDKNIIVKKNNLRFYFHIYKIIFIQDIKSKMIYRTDFLISMIGLVFTNISGLIGFWITFQHFETIEGWSYYEMLFLYGFTLLTLTPVQLFFENNWNLRYSVFTGNFIKYCFRPLNIYFYYISETIDIKGFGQLFIGLFTLIYSSQKINFIYSFTNILLLLFSLLIGSLFMIAIMNIAAAAGFWVMKASAVMSFAFKLKDYAKYPITIFSSFFQFIFCFILPIAFISYYPCVWIIRPERIPVSSYLSPLIGLVFIFLSYKIWMKGALNYDGTGS